MALKENAKLCNIREQIFEDASGLTIQFEVVKGERDGKPIEETVMRLFGDCLPMGNRELFFASDGHNSGSGTHMSGGCKPTWQTEIE